MVKKLLLVLFLMISAAPAFAKNGGGSGSDSGSGSGSGVSTEGLITAISADSISVAGLTFAITPSTKFEDAASRSVPVTAFTVGDRVEVRGTSSNGALTATKIEMQTDVSSSPDDHGAPGSDDGSNHDIGDDHGQDPGTDPSENEDVTLGAPLDDDNAVDDSAHGAIKLTNKVRTKKTEQRLIVNARVPGKSPVKVQFSRNGSVFAACTAAAKISSKRGRSSQSKLRIDVRSRIKNGVERLRSSKGSCDTDTATDGTQAGVPDLSPGDLAEVKDASDNTLLTAHF